LRLDRLARCLFRDRGCLIMASLENLIQYRADLEQVRFTGTRRVKDSNGEEVEFKSDSELARALAAVNAEIAAAQSHPASIIYLSTSKGV